MPVAHAIGHHEILERLGEGGMGVVYKARDTRLGRIVALKVLSPACGRDPTHRRRLVSEAQNASQLNHPNIVTIYEIGTDGDTDYIAMEYVRGQTLAAIIRAGALAVERALKLVLQVTDALVVAHAAGVIHRDLKPSNIIVADGDRVKVVDFGLAKQISPTSPDEETAEALTMAGTLIGTAQYMSPEQASGRPVDARSDLFSLGTFLYEALSGRPPFVGETPVDTIAAILHDQPPPLDTVPPAVAHVVDGCLRKKVSERFQSAAELRAAVESCLNQGGERAKTGADGIAVFPFVNMNGLEEDLSLCEGLAEEIINALDSIRGLRVIARTSAFAAARMGLDLREVGAKLGVDTVLEGSVRRAGKRVRVVAQLVRTADAVQLWSERYDREVNDIFALEDEIAAAIARRLRGELSSGRQRAERREVEPEAHAAFLEGRYYFARGTPDALTRAETCYRRAIELDPAFALAYDSLAELFWFFGFFGALPPRDAFAQSTWHALRALELDDGLAETHALLGMLRKELDYNWIEVDREIGRALELNPTSPLVRLRYAISGLMPRGRVEEAVTEMESVVASDPLSLFSLWWLANMNLLGRDYDRVIDEGRHIVDLDPGYFLGYWTLGMGLDGVGDLAGAVEALERSHQLSGGIPLTLGFLAYAFGRAGRNADLQALMDAAAKESAGRYRPPFVFALAALGVGDWDAAFGWMDRAIEERDPFIMPIKSYYFLDSVREDPRYAALLRKMNLL